MAEVRESTCQQATQSLREDGYIQAKSLSTDVGTYSIVVDMF